MSVRESLGPDLIDNAALRFQCSCPEPSFVTAISERPPAAALLPVGTDVVCGICGNSQHNRFVVAREMMFGMGGAFRYLHCGACAVLHLVDMPADMAAYYPASSYYSVHNVTGRLKRWVMALRDKGSVGRSFVGRQLARRYPNVALEATLQAVADPGARILDVGCGNGELLRSMARLGFHRLSGVDPLLDKTTTVDGVYLQSGELAAVHGEFDLITFHHSLEHVRDQVGVLTQARQRLAKDGRIVVRVPASDSFAFEAYGVHWFQLDAPRHLFLHSRKSIECVAKDARLVVEKLYHDSRPAQFWASEMYRDGVPLTSPDGARYRRRRKAFFHELTAFVNAHLMGDQMVIQMRAGAA